MHLTKKEDKFEDHHDIYTDGSKPNKGVGVSVYYKDSDNKIHRFYTLDIKAIKLALSMG